MKQLSVTKYLNPITILAFVIVLYVTRNAIPYLTSILLILLVVYQFFHFKYAVHSLVKCFKVFFPVFLLIFIELIAFCCTPFPLHPKSFFYLKNLTFISMFLFLFSSMIQNMDDFKHLLKQTGNFFVLFSILMALLGLWKFFYYPSLFSYYEAYRGYDYIWGSSPVSDYNFFALFLFNGLVFGLYKIVHGFEKIKYKTLFFLVLQIIIGAGIFSGSRRMMICLCIFFAGCFMLFIPPVFKKAFPNFASHKYLVIFLITSLLNFGIIYSFLTYFPLISEKAEKVVRIDSQKVNSNIYIVSRRVNSAVFFNMITPRSAVTGEKQLEILSLTESRQKLWDLGKSIYSNYSIPQKIYGRGFLFFKVIEEETKEFYYPHHLFLSILLFSGVLGMVAFLAVLFWACYIYLFHFKELWVIFALLLFNLLFGFFSFTEFFGASFYAILLIFPFYYQYLHKKIIQTSIAN